MTTNAFSARDTFDTGNGQAGIYRLSKLEDAGLGKISALPYSIRVMLEAVLRNCDGFSVSEDDVKNLAAWEAASPAKLEIPFKPSRVVLQDFTGVPAVVDLAAMRSAMQRLGGDPKKINPLIPVDLVIDHSVQVDRFGSAACPGRWSTSRLNSSAMGALRVPALGAKGVLEFPGGAAQRLASCTR